MITLSAIAAVTSMCSACTPPAGKAVAAADKPHSDTQMEPHAKAPKEPQSKAPKEPQSKARRCIIENKHDGRFDGPCRLRMEGDGRSFSVAPLEQKTILGAVIVSVTVIETEQADVRGLTTEGINSRWGLSRWKEGCWKGSDFSICLR